MKKLSEEKAFEIREKIASLAVEKFVKSVKAAKDAGEFRVKMTDETVDRYGEIIKIEGWDFKNFMKNPVVLWGHSHFNLPIGIITNIESTNEGVFAEGKFAPVEANPMAAQVQKLYELGFQKAVSVGFIEKDRDEENPNIITKAELIELSFVTVPANPEALSTLAASELSLNELVTKGLVGLQKTGVKSEGEEEEIEEKQEEETPEETEETLEESEEEVEEETGEEESEEETAGEEESKESKEEAEQEEVTEEKTEEEKTAKDIVLSKDFVDTIKQFSDNFKELNDSIALALEGQKDSEGNEGVEVDSELKNYLENRKSLQVISTLISDVLAEKRLELKEKGVIK